MSLLSVSNQTNEDFAIFCLPKWARPGRKRQKRACSIFNPGASSGSSIPPILGVLPSLLALWHIALTGQKWAQQTGASGYPLLAGSGQATVPQWGRYQGWAQPPQGPLSRSVQLRGASQEGPRACGGGDGATEVSPPGGVPGLDCSGKGWQGGCCREGPVPNFSSWTPSLPSQHPSLGRVLVGKVHRGLGL